MIFFLILDLRSRGLRYSLLLFCGHCHQRSTLDPTLHSGFFSFPLFPPPLLVSPSLVYLLLFMDPCKMCRAVLYLFLIYINGIVYKSLFFFFKTIFKVSLWCCMHGSFIASNSCFLVFHVADEKSAVRLTICRKSFCC